MSTPQEQLAKLEQERDALKNELSQLQNAMPKEAAAKELMQKMSQGQEPLPDQETWGAQDKKPICCM